MIPIGIFIGNSIVNKRGGISLSSIGSIITEDDFAFLTEDNNYIIQE